MIFTKLLSCAVTYGRNRVYILDVYCVFGNVLRKGLGLVSYSDSAFYLTTYFNST